MHFWDYFARATVCKTHLMSNSQTWYLHCVSVPHMSLTVFPYMACFHIKFLTHSPALAGKDNQSKQKKKTLFLKLHCCGIVLFSACLIMLYILPWWLKRQQCAVSYTPFPYTTTMINMLAHIHSPKKNILPQWMSFTTGHIFPHSSNYKCCRSRSLQVFSHFW